MTRFPRLAALLALVAISTAGAADLPETMLPTMDGFLPYESVAAARFSGDGTLLWASNQVQLKAWDVASGRLVYDEGTAYARTWKSTNFRFNGSMGQHSVKFLTASSRDGRLLAVTHWDAALKPTTMLWDANARTMRHVGSYREIAGFAPDNSRMVVVAHSGDVEIRDPVSGNLDRVLSRGKDGNAWLPGDGTWLASAGKLYTWPWDQPQKNKSNSKRRFNLLVGDYLDDALERSVIHVNADRSLRLRRPPAQRDAAGNWASTLVVERADGSMVLTYRTGDAFDQAALVGNTGLLALLLTQKPRVRLVSIDSGEVVREYGLVEDAGTFDQRVAAQLQQSQSQHAANQAAEAAALANRIAGRPAEYQQFLANFSALPAAWVLDYNSLQGRDITTDAWASRHFGPFFGGQTFNAIGRVADCANGSVAVLTLTRSQRGGADVALFQLLAFDVDGKPVLRQEIGSTQKDASGRPLAVSFAMRSDASQASFDIRQSRWDGDRTNSLTLDKKTCTLR
jgi:hypothetical protein